MGLARYARRGQIDADERHPVLTPDGWTIWLHRFRPAVQKHDVPVILGHGLMMNRWCWSLSPGGSLPRALADRVHDVWVAEYRGSGMSRPPTGTPMRWSFEDHVQQDVPALIDAVRTRTSRPGVHWVGHSMGGMVAYLHTGRRKLDSGVERLVTIGSPVQFGHVRRIMGPLGHPARRLLRSIGIVPVRPLLFLGLPFVALVPQVALRISGASEHLSLQERLALTSLAFEDSSSDLCAFFMDRWLRNEGLCAADELVGSRSGFAEIDVPTLVVAGQKDVLAPPSAVKPAFDETEGIPAAYRLFGDPEAAPQDAGPALGHADLISGTVAVQHVLPLIAEWLETPEPQAVCTPTRANDAPLTLVAPATDAAALEP